MSTPDKKHAFGVVFVHGIGEQAEGETLLAFGEPLLRWFEHWLNRRGSTVGDGVVGQVTALHTNLTPSLHSADEPPNTDLRVTVWHAWTEEPEVLPKWMFAETWWGGDVQRPSFGRFALWLLTEGAWTVVTHATKRGAFEGTDGWAGIRHALSLVLWSGFTVLVQLVTLAISALALLPIPVVRGWLTDLLRLMTGVLGDSFVLVESDLQRAGIVSKARRSIDWVAARCERVVVVAHSQGAAVAHLALRDGAPENVEALITLGSGVGKLEELRRRRVGEPVRFRPEWLMPSVLTALTAFAFAVGALGTGTLGVKPVLIMTVVTMLFCLLYLHLRAEQHWSKWIDEVASLRVRRGTGSLRWVDYYSSHDLVPNGPLAPPVREREPTDEHGPTAIEMYEPVEVVNQRSFFGDHTAYFDTTSEFVTRLARGIDDLLGTGMIDARGWKLLDDTIAEHRRRVRWLVVSRASALLAPLVLWFGSHETLVELGDWTLSALALLFGSFEELAMRLPEQVLAGIGLVPALAGAIVLQRGYQVLWSGWDDAALHEQLDPARTPSIERRRAARLIMAVGAVLPVLVAAGWEYAREISFAAVVEVVLYLVIAMVAAAIVFWLRYSRDQYLAWRKAQAGDREAQAVDDARKSFFGSLALLASVVIGGAFMFFDAVQVKGPIVDFVNESLLFVLVVLLGVQLQKQEQAELRQRDAPKAQLVMVGASPALTVMVGLVFVIRRVAAGQAEVNWLDLPGLGLGLAAAYFFMTATTAWIAGFWSRKR